MNRVVMHVETLLLQGFRYEDRHDIALGLQRELTRIFADPEAVRQLAIGGDLPRLKVGGIQIKQGMNPQSIGAHLAIGIGKRIKP